MASDRRVTFVIEANARLFRKGLGRAQRSLKKFGRRTERLGRSITRNFSAPIGAAGVAAVKMASDFQSSMTRIQTLVGLSRDQVQGMRADVLALAQESGRGPKELSEALFTVTSAGIRGAEAMDVLERSAKAAALGLGETRDIARALTGVMQSYQDEGLEAAEATDTLTAIVREGNLEASELAPVLGRVTGIASQLGVSFSEVGASIATFTRLGVSSEEAVTGLRGTMNALLKPTAQGKKALDAVGMSFEGLRKQVREEGLMATLRGLIDAFDGNVEGLSRVIPRVRALSSVLGTAGAQGEEYEQILNNIQESAGIVNDGFEEVSETTEQKWNKALANLRVTAIKLGTDLLPVANQIIGKVSDMATVFSNMSEESRAKLLKLAGVLVVGGPLLTGIGKLSKGIAALIGGFRNMITWSLKAASAIRAVGAAAKTSATVITGLVGAITALSYANFQGQKRSDSRVNAIRDEIAAIESSAVANEKLIETERAIAKVQAQMAKGARGLGKRLEDLRQKRDELIDQRNMLTRQEVGSVSMGVGGLNALIELQEFINTDLTGSFGRASEAAQGANLSLPFVEAKKPVDELLWGLDMVEEGFQELTAEQILSDEGNVNIPDKMFPPGSLGALQNKLRAFRTELSYAVNPQKIESLQNKIGQTKNQIQQLTGQTRQSGMALEGFLSALDRIFQQAVLHGKKLGGILSNIAKQLASKALINGLAMLLSGGSFGVGKLLFGSIGSIIPGMAHGGVVPSGFPNDTYPAMLSSGETVIPSPKPLPSGVGGKQKIENHLYIGGREVELALEDRNYETNR